MGQTGGNGELDAGQFTEIEVWQATGPDQVAVHGVDG